MAKMFRIEGAETLVAELEDRLDPERIQRKLPLACALVEGSAKRKAPKGDGTLRSSIAYRVEGNKGIVYTPLEYAPYVEFGTGIFAEKEGREGYWVYVKDGGGSDKRSSKSYTEEEAKQVMAILRKKGLEAYYTNGQHPHPFLRPALHENREKILKLLKEGLAK